MAFLLIFSITLIMQCLCTIYHSYSIGNGLSPITAFSAGVAHITIAYGTSSDPTVTTSLQMYDALFNITTKLSSTLNIAITSMNQLKATNTPSTNFYIIEEPSSLNYMKNNFATIAYQKTLDPTIYQSVHSCFGATTSEIYYCLNSGATVSIVQLTNNTLIASYVSTLCKAIAYTYQHIYTLVQSADLVTVVIHSILYKSPIIKQTFSNPTLAGNVNIQTSTKFYTVSFAQSVHVYYVNNYSNVCNLTSLQQKIYDIKITDRWIYISFTSVVEQYDIVSCILLGSYSTNAKKLIQTHQPGIQSLYGKVFLLTPGQYSIDVLSVEDKYACPGGCVSCSNYYWPLQNEQCYYTGINYNYPTNTNPSTTDTTSNTSNSTTNTTNSSIKQTNTTNSSIKQTNTTNSSIKQTNTTNSSINQTNTTNSSIKQTNTTNSSIKQTNTTNSSINQTNTTNSSINQTNTTNSSIKQTNTTNSSIKQTNTTNSSINQTNTTNSSIKQTNTTNSSINQTNTTNSSINQTNTTTNTTNFSQLICNYKCQTCQFQPTNCTECSYRRTQTPNCQLPTSIVVAYATISAANTFRPSSSQFAYYFIDNLQLYQYHSKHYSGIISDVLLEINYVESVKWNMISVEYVLGWTRTSYFNNSLYDSYTNYRFLEVERENALIYETAKAYYAVYLPVVFVGFLLLNRLFWCLQRFQVSQILRTYSFWLQYIVIVVLSDSTKLSFLSLNYLQMLFSFSINAKLIHAASIMMIGVLVIALLSLFFMSSYFYGDLCRYFLGNVYRIKYAMGYNFVRFSVRPLVEAALHVLFFANGKAQLLSLSCLQIVSIAMMFAYEINYNAFKSKILFAGDILLSFSAALLNLLLYWEYYAFNQYAQVVELLELAIKSLIYVNIAILLAIMAYTFLSALKVFFKKKTEVNNQSKEKQDCILNSVLQEGQQIQKTRPQLKSNAVNKVQKHQNQNTINPFVTEKKVKKKQINTKFTNDKTNNNLVIRHTTIKGTKNTQESKNSRQT